MGLKEVGCESEGWIELAQHGLEQWWRPFVNIAMNLRIPQKGGVYFLAG
jgi:hypothetical protein